MKRILGIILSLCMLLSILPANVFAATQIGRSDVTVNEPEVGAKPIASASLYNQSLEVVNVEWVGELDANGCFKANTAYTINITIRIKAGQDKYLVDNGGFRINRRNATMTSMSEDKQQAVISYTFNNGASAAGNSASDNSAEPVAMEDRIDFKIEEPSFGGKAATTATTTHPDVEVTNVSWSGEFAADGTFQLAKNYKVTISFKLKDNVNKKITGSALQCKATVNGISKVYYKGGDDKNGFVIHTFEVAAPIPVVDMDYVYSKEKADADWTTVNPKYPTEIIVNEGEQLKEFVDVFNYEQMNSVKKVVLNYTYNTKNGDDENAPLTANSSDVAVFMSFYNLEELWLGPNVDVVDFLNDYANLEFGLSGSDILIPLSSSNYETQKLTMFVSDKTLPNGFTGNWNRMKSSAGSDGYVYRNTGPFKRFQSRLYSGDVLEAYKKGPSAGYEWCTDHDYSDIINTADRVYQMLSCTQPTLYYYSCSKCGKCEYNPNHVARSLPHLAGNYHMLMDMADHYTMDRNLSDKYYIGTNSRGERAYWKSCVGCGVTHGEVLYGYEQPKNGEWEAEQATVTKDSVYAFAVRGDRHVTAKMSEWAQNEVQWASQNGILDLNLLGSDYTKPITRLQFASIAVKLAEVLTGKEIIPADVGIFTDTDNEYALKAYAAGITSGVSATEFNPNGTLTRQQMATFIHRALMYVRDNTNIRYTIYTPELEKYSDNRAIQDWARTPMDFMNALGLVKGVSDTAIDPNGKCTIEQAAVVANRSVNADQIGWYQSNPAKGEISTLSFENDFFHAPDEHAPTQADYTNGLRIWVHSPKSGYQKASENPDNKTDWLPTTYPFADFNMWVRSSDFKAIKDLKDGDEAYFNSFYGK